MRKPKSAQDKAKNPLDTSSQKRGRGRPPKVVASWIAGRSENFRGILRRVWTDLWPLLSRANTEHNVVEAIQTAMPGESEFTPLASLILRVLKGSDFPKTPRGRINFLADSVAGLGWVSPRRSRDICAEQRLMAKRAHHIIRYEFYVECSCGYTGHSRDHACPNCNASIPLELDLFG